MNSKLCEAREVVRVLSVAQHGEGFPIRCYRKKAAVPALCVGFVPLLTREDQDVPLSKASCTQGRVRTKTVKKASRVIIEKYYQKLTLDFDINKRVAEDVATIQTKRLRNKIAGFTTVSALLWRPRHERADGVASSVVCRSPSRQCSHAV